MNVVGKGHAPVRQQGKIKILMITRKFKSVAKETGTPFYYLEPRKFLHVDGGKHWPIIETMEVYRGIYKEPYNLREGNGNPLQYSCLENPMDGGAWWAAVYGVTQSWTRLKRLSSSSSSSIRSMRAWQPTPVFLPGESPRTEEPGGLQSVGSQRVGHNWVIKHIRSIDGYIRNHLRSIGWVYKQLYEVSPVGVYDI